MKKTKIMLSFFMMAMAVVMISCSPEDGVDGINGTDGINGIDGKMGPQGTQGPAGEDGTDGTDGTDGNANVTLYTFPAHDFETAFFVSLAIPEIESKTEMVESVWYVYLVDVEDESVYYDHVPGITFLGDTYSVSHSWEDALSIMRINIELRVGSGTAYEEIEVVRIEATNTVAPKGANSDSIVPDDLDMSNFEEVAAYYNLN